MPIKAQAAMPFRKGMIVDEKWPQRGQQEFDGRLEFWVWLDDDLVMDNTANMNTNVPMNSVIKLCSRFLFDGAVQKTPSFVFASSVSSKCCL